MTETRVCDATRCEFHHDPADPACVRAMYRGPGGRARRLAIAEVAQWLLDHATGKRADFYAPSKSGTETLRQAAEALISGKGPR